MFTILLVIIYIAFISLGLPDAMLGSVWPVMHGEFNVPVSYAGIVTMIIAGGTILSSLFSHKVIHKLGTGKVTAISVGLTAVALFGFSISNSYLLICFWAIPLGLGAGSVDAALNNFVALHYKSRHMSWLHCFWGVGATLGPYIMGYFLSAGQTWNSGYRTTSILQIVLTAILILSLPLWRKATMVPEGEEHKNRNLPMKELIRLPGAISTLTAFFCYCSLEATAGLWAASYMVLNRGMSTETAAKWASFFYLGITAGRFLCGFITFKLNDKSMIRLGQGLAVMGILMLLLPFGTLFMCIGFIVIGIGCAPIYPCIIHQTPIKFGTDLSQAMIGMQMACAYTGSTFMPPLFGLLVGIIDIKLYPFFLIFFVIMMIVMLERLNHTHTVGEKVALTAETQGK